MTKQTFESWTPEKFETTGETPQDLLRRVELDELVVKYSNDWMVRLFVPLGLREALEADTEILMRKLHQSYDAVMSMPCSRRRRLVERVAQASKG